ncbi:argininosuccinate lyase [Sulfodiicoccus acidiphilus]|uniref:Argininosuccinate lyase n=1 Tax=Sulfodiicoccus acidiphilus TaxID=1670455 RepID=A0A348B0P5_9CREN|nr:argininosuccinate lyase [Sulfodiicoccus acidiphilus]BBD71747.1 argininosuccinate lyase [Sulfodiicoccus acidiphilus]GGT86177.1 argininosuccinate lyase [Sulfodiicoccus acidiphilus]
MLYRKWGNESDFVVSFTSSLISDKEIQEEVKKVMIVHVLELNKLGIVSRELGAKLLKAIEEFQMDGGKFEDIHEGLEAHLISRVGQEAGVVGLGRSRNDHVATALRLKMREELLRVLDELLELRQVVLERSSTTIEKVFPTFTHLQQAQPSTLAHYMLHVEEEMSSLWENLFSSLRAVNRSPLGAGAVVGTQVPLDRKREARVLGFEGVLVNTISATSSRADLLMVSMGLTLLLTVLSRFAEDLVVYSSMGIVKLPDSHVSTSSLMPQKRNPVTAEIMRAKAADAIGHMTSLLSNYKGLPTGYNLDLQEMNPHYWELAHSALSSISVFKDIVKNLSIGKKVEEGFLSPYTLSTDEAERRSMAGEPYRTAYSEVASEVIQGKFKPSLDFVSSISSKAVMGSPSPRFLSSDLEVARIRLNEDYSRLAKYRSSIEEGLRLLEVWKNELLQKGE